VGEQHSVTTSSLFACLRENRHWKTSLILYYTAFLYVECLEPKAKSHPPVIDLTMSSDEEEGGNDCARTSRYKTLPLTCLSALKHNLILLYSSIFVLLKRIPVLSSMPSAHHPAMPSFLYPIADQSSVLDLGMNVLRNVSRRRIGPCATMDTSFVLL
jgi:hypothetical protein